MLDKPQLDALLSEDCITLLSVALKESSLFVTPNTRLAAHLRELLDAIIYHYLGDQNCSWETPLVMPFDAWFQSLWKDAVFSSMVEPKILLSSAQDIHFWEQAIAGSPSLETLLSKHAAALQAQQAYQLLNQALINADAHKFEFDAQVDSGSFYDWMLRYEKLIATSNYLSLSVAQRYLLRVLSEQGEAEKNDSVCEVSLPSSVAMVGFTAATPLQTALLKQISNVLDIQLTARTDVVESLSFDDFYAELSAAAKWAQAQQAQSPSDRIAVVVQDLKNNKLAVERVFSQQFQSSRSANAGHCYNISAGVPLAQVEIVKQALLLLATTAKSLPVDDWVSLISSPFLLNASGQLNIKRKLIYYLHATGESTLSLSQLKKLILSVKDLKPLTVDDCFLSLMINADAEALKLLRAKPQYPSQWAVAFASYLTLFDWPGSRLLNSEEYQQHAVFESAFNSFSSLDSILSRLSLQEALSHFQRHCQQQVFHIETIFDESLLPVQVLGGLEASGQVFNHLWLMGMSEGQWPSKPSAHPLIPISLQLEYDLPNSSVAREFDYAKRMTQSYLLSAQQIKLSHPATIDDINVKLSPVFLLISKQISMDISLASRAVPIKKISDERSLESEFEFLVDDAGLPIPSSVSHQGLPGGSALLKDHHANPLKTYFKWRLGVRPLESEIKGISALERGNALHTALELIWTDLGGWRQLVSSTEQAIDALVERSVSLAIDRALSRRFVIPSFQLVELEKVRIKKTLLTWLKLEAARPEFLIHACELSFSYHYNQHQIKLRIDRIDRLKDGHLLLIDYKSGKVAASGWTNEVLSEPQLPLYAIALATEEHRISKCSSAIAFARVKAGEDQAYVGLSANDSSAALEINGVKTADFESWQGQLAVWTAHINQSIEELVNGQVLLDLDAIFQLDPSYEPAMRLSHSYYTHDKSAMDVRFNQPCRLSSIDQDDE